MQDKKYSGYDTQCKVCKQAVKYNSSIACSICKHFTHGKCNDLTNSDISKIENLIDSHICYTCTKNIFPLSIFENESCKKISKTYKSRHCFTCKNTTEKPKYHNKKALYNNKVIKFCKNCSLNTDKIPIKDASKLEFLDCSISRLSRISRFQFSVSRMHFAAF